MTTEGNAMLSCEAGSISQSSPGSFTLTWEGDDVNTYPTFGEALAGLAELYDTYSGPITYGLSRDQLWKAAEEAGVNEILPYSTHGWVRCEGVWLPGALLPDYDGPDDSFPVLDEFGEMGCSASAIQWENVTLILWHGPEGEDRGFEVKLDQTLAEASAAAEEKAGQVQLDWNLFYDVHIGLGNLAVADKFPIPDDVTELGEVSSYLREWSDSAATVGVVYWGAGGDAPFLVTSGTEVVGRYQSLEALRSHIEPGDAFAASDEIIDPESM